MNYQEFGTEGKATVLLLHGGGLNWWNYREAAQLLAADYRVILPILDGHAGSGKPFTAIEDCAAEIIAFIDGHLGGTVSLIGGLSLGGQVLAEMLSQRSGLCRCALVESAVVIPSKVARALIAPAFGSSYGLIRKEWFARMQFRSLRMKEELFRDYFRDTCRIEKSDLIAFMQASTAYALKDSIIGCGAKVRVYVGEKENRGIKRSAEMLGEKIPGCRVTALPGLYHGEFSINHPAEYAKAVREMLRD